MADEVEVDEVEEIGILRLAPECRSVHQINVLTELLKKIPCMAKHARNASMSELALSAELLECDKNYTVFQQGENGDRFYYIMHGEVGVFFWNGKWPDSLRISVAAAMKLRHGVLDDTKRKPPLGVQVATLTAGKEFGEVALLQDQPRSATIKCLVPSKFLVIRAVEFKRIVLQKFQQARKEKEKFAAQYVMRTPLSDDRSAAQVSLYFFSDQSYVRNHVFAQAGAPVGRRINFIMEGNIAVCGSKAPKRLTPRASKPPTVTMALISGAGQTVEPWLVACPGRILINPFTCIADSARVRTLSLDTEFFFTRLKEQAVAHHRSGASSQLEYLSRRAIVHEKEKKKLDSYIGKHMTLKSPVQQDSRLCSESPFLTEKLGHTWAQKSFVLQHLGHRVIKCDKSEIWNTGQETFAPQQGASAIKSYMHLSLVTQKVQQKMMEAALEQRNSQQELAATEYASNWRKNAATDQDA